MGGHAHTRLRSPYAWSIRDTGGQYLSLDDVTAATERAYECFQSLAITFAAGCGALCNGLSSGGHSAAPTRSISARIAIMASQKRSSSFLSSDSVGSIINVPA